MKDPLVLAVVAIVLAIAALVLAVVLPGAQGPIGPEGPQGPAGPSMIVAMGTVEEDGSIRSALNAKSITWNDSMKWWEVTLTGIDYDLSNYLTVVSRAWTSSSGYATYGSMMGKLIVVTFDSNWAPAKRGFSFVVFNVTAS